MQTKVENNKACSLLCLVFSYLLPSSAIIPLMTVVTLFGTGQYLILRRATSLAQSGFKQVMLRISRLHEVIAAQIYLFHHHSVNRSPLWVLVFA